MLNSMDAVAFSSGWRKKSWQAVRIWRRSMRSEAPWSVEFLDRLSRLVSAS